MDYNLGEKFVTIQLIHNEDYYIKMVVIGKQVILFAIESIIKYESLLFKCL